MSDEEIVVTPELSPLQRLLLEQVRAACMRYLSTYQVPYGQRFEGPVMDSMHLIERTVTGLMEMKDAGKL